MQRAEALALVKEYNPDQKLWRHPLEVEGVMRYMARQAGEDEEEWGLVGLLHDLDYEKWPEEHCYKTAEILREKNVDEKIIRAIQSHGWRPHLKDTYSNDSGQACTEVEPKTLMEKTLYAIDELTGLIWAASLLRPSKSFQDMELKSVKKKFKDKSFAANVDRQVILRGAEMLGLEIDQLINETLAGLKEYERNLGEK